MPKETLVITITPTDAATCGPYTSTHNCLLATAIKRQTGLPASCGGCTATLGGRPYVISDEGNAILRRYKSTPRKGWTLLFLPVVKRSFKVTLTRWA